MKILIFIITVFFTLSSAKANDSSAGIAAGGLELLKSEDISMESEQLYISSKVIRVNYVFKNNSDKDIKTLVAFPLSKLPSDAIRAMEDVNIPNEKSENFVNFKVKVDNADIPVEIDNKAFIGSENSQQKEDITDDLKKYNIPLSPFSKNYQNNLNTLPAAIKNKLFEKHWVVDEDNESHDTAKNILGTWETQTTLYWTQVFPANKTLIISHEYNPSVEGFVGINNVADIDNKDLNMRNRFCIDKATENAINTKLQSKEKEAQKYLGWKNIHYILTTANNWQGPIKDFKLILDKDDANNIISVCLSNIKKINTTQFAAEYKNFVPNKDLDILILNPYSLE